MYTDILNDFPLDCEFKSKTTCPCLSHVSFFDSKKSRFVLIG